MCTPPVNKLVSNVNQIMTLFLSVVRAFVSSTSLKVTIFASHCDPGVHPDSLTDSRADSQELAYSAFNHATANT
jgi:hypothetical protein